MTRLNARILLAAALFPALSGQAAAAVGSTTLEELVVNSDVIVIGTADRVVDLLGTRVGVLRVEETLKGAPREEVFVLTEGTWMCEVTETVPGERVLLFLERHPWEGDWELYEQDAIDEDDAPFDWALRPGFGKALTELKGNEPLLRLAGEGCGQMPVRAVDGVEYAVLWMNKIRIPSRIETIAGSEKHAFIRSAQLQDLEEYVRALVDLMRKWRPELE